MVNSGATYSGYTITLAGDIDLSGHNWVPIGNSNHAFRGILDGKWYTISGLNCISENLACAGLFGCTVNSTLKNINLSGGIISSLSSDSICAGGLVGMAVDTDIANSSSSVEVKAFSMNNYVFAGSLIGYFDTLASNSVINCSASGNITAISYDGKDVYCGGLAGGIGNYSANPIQINGCSYSGGTARVSAFSGSLNSISLGGLFGFVKYATIENCSSSGSLFSNAEAQKGKSVGGLVGNSEIPEYIILIHAVLSA